MPLHSSVRGFTLIELMLVVSVIGVLAAVAIPQYQDYTLRARISEVWELTSPSRHAINEYYDRWGRFPKDNAAAGLAAPEFHRGKAVKSIAVTEGMIEVRLHDHWAGAVKEAGQGRSVYLRPAVNRAYPTGALVWLCLEQKAPDGFDAIGRKGDKPIDVKYLGACR
jgi:type IV pilus assembly protein PilA